MPNKYYSEIVVGLPMAAMLDGRMFRWLYNGSLAVEGVKEFLFLMPPSKSLLFHGREFSTGLASVRLDVYTDPTFSSEGTTFNNYISLNADVPVEAQAQVWQDPVITDAGLLIDVDVAYGSTSTGNRGSSGSVTSRDFPRIIPKSQYLLARISHLGDSADPAEVLYKLFWEEI